MSEQDIAQARRDGIEAVIAILEEQLKELRPEARVNYPKAVALDDAITAARLLLEEKAK